MKLYLRESQNVSSMLNELFSVKENEVELIFPEESGFFDEEENLELLKNQTNLMQKRITILSPNQRHVELARAHGIPAETRKKKGKIDIEEPFFEEVEEGLHQDTPAMEEFTRRYFDLGPPKTSPEGKQKEEQKYEEIPIKTATSLEEQPAITDEKEKLPQEKLLKTKERKIGPIFKDMEDTEKESLTTQLHESSGKKRVHLVYKLGALVIGIGVLFFLYAYLPEASVEVFAQREKFSFSLDVTAKKNIASIDSEARTIPVQRIQITKELSTPFTVTTKGTFSEKARGEVTVFNKNPDPQFMIPSRFQSANGTIYWSQRNIRIPAKSSLQIEVVAAEPGEAYNLTCSEQSPCEFTIPAWKGTPNFTTIFATATNPLAGGVAGEGFIVSEEEYQKAEIELRNNLIREAQAELSLQIPENFTLLEDTVRSEVVEISSNPPISGLSKDGKATIRGIVRLEAFLISESDIKKLVDVIVKTQITEGKETKPDTVAIEYSTTSINVETSEVSLRVAATEDVAVILDTDGIKSRLAGKSEGEVREILSQMPNIQSAEVTLWPFWVRNIPEDKGKINVEVK